MGYELRYAALISPVISAVLDIVCNPKATLTRIVQRMTRLRKSGSRRSQPVAHGAWSFEEETYGWD